MSSKRYPEEFKIAAVKQVMEGGYSAPYGESVTLYATLNKIFRTIVIFGPCGV